MDASRLKEKLAKVEALLAGAKTDGERAAASTARQRITERLREMASEDPPIEHRFSIQDPHARSLFLALARRYGLRPYRRHGQHRQSIMIVAPRKFVDEILYPEFVELDEALQAQLFQMTDEIIKRTVHKDTSDSVEEAPALLKDKH